MRWKGEIVPGEGIGSRQTVPTLNLRTASEVIPLDGVYLTRTLDLEKRPELEFDHQHRHAADPSKARPDHRDVSAGSAGRGDAAENPPGTAAPGPRRAQVRFPGGAQKPDPGKTSDGRMPTFEEWRAGCGPHYYRSMSISPGKLKHLKALSNENGIIAAAAMDQRGSLQKSLAAAKGVDLEAISQEMMEEFKTAVSKVLTPHASAIPARSRVRPCPRRKRAPPTPVCCWLTKRAATITPRSAACPICCPWFRSSGSSTGEPMR